MTGVTLKHGGLIKGIASRRCLQQLILNVGRRGLGLSDRELSYLRVSIDACHERDFEKGAICAHWKRVDTLAEELGCSPRQINNIERSLEAKGLIFRTIGMDGHRRGARCGNILWAKGINLAPLLASEKLRQLLAMRQQQDERQFALLVIKQEIQITRRRIFASRDECLIEQANEIIPRGRTSRHNDVERLQNILDALQAVQNLIAAEPGAGKISDEVAEFADASEIQDTPYNTETTSKNLCMPPRREKPEVGLRQALLLASKAYQERVEILGGPSSANLVEASWQSCAELGISGARWQKLCDRMGRYEAAITILVIDRNARQVENDPYHVRSPAGCAEAISRQWRAGSVNLRGLLLAGHRMNRDRALPEHLAQPHRRFDASNIGQLLANALRNFDPELRP